MASIGSLQRQVRAMKEQLEPVPTLRIFYVEEGKDIEPEQGATIRARDTVIIEEIPRGYFTGE